MYVCVCVSLSLSLSLCGVYTMLYYYVIHISEAPKTTLCTHKLVYNACPFDPLNFPIREPRNITTTSTSTTATAITTATTTIVVASTTTTAGALFARICAPFLVRGAAERVYTPYTTARGS